MKAVLVGMMGLALMAPTSAVVAQEAVGASPSTATPVTASPTPEATGASMAPSTTGSPDTSSSAPDAAPASTAETTQASVPQATAEATATNWEGPIPEAYLGTTARISDTALNAWLAQPRTLLDNNPDGGLVMVRFVRSLVGTDNRTPMALVNLVKGPDVRDIQVAAVADGLAGAMRDAEVPAPEYAAYIQWVVAQSESRELIAAFERASGADEDQTAAIGAPGGAGAGAQGSGSLAGTGTPGPSGPVGGDATVTTAGGLIGSRGGSGSISYNESDDLLQGANGGLIVCTLDTSPAGCQRVF